MLGYSITKINNSCSLDSSVLCWQCCRLIWWARHLVVLLTKLYQSSHLNPQPTTNQHLNEGVQHIFGLLEEPRSPSWIVPRLSYIPWTQMLWWALTSFFWWSSYFFLSSANKLIMQQCIRTFRQNSLKYRTLSHRNNEKHTSQYSYKYFIMKGKWLS